MEFSKFVGAGVSKSFRVLGETLRVVVERSSWLGALNLNWLGVIDESPLQGLW